MAGKVKLTEAWRDPKKYKTGKLVRCLGCKVTCHETPWGKWCYDCNVARIERIDKAFAPIRAPLASSGKGD